MGNSENLLYLNPLQKGSQADSTNLPLQTICKAPNRLCLDPIIKGIQHDSVCLRLLGD